MAGFDLGSFRAGRSQSEVVGLELGWVWIVGSVWIGSGMITGRRVQSR